ncbi:MAG TPA: hypothetical protein VMK12_16925 [Anaeromyxobacteraceae bacterium]|nr:hypothetical protein [Anaeromyxobacteraceae bacterium]
MPSDLGKTLDHLDTARNVLFARLGKLFEAFETEAMRVAKEVGHHDQPARQEHKKAESLVVHLQHCRACNASARLDGCADRIEEELNSEEDVRVWLIANEHLLAFFFGHDERREDLPVGLAVPCTIQRLSTELTHKFPQE